MDILISVLTSVAACLLGAIITDIYTRFKKSGRKAVEKKRQEHIADIEKIVKETLGAEIEQLNRNVNSIVSQDIPVLKEANCSSLRDQLTNNFIRCHAQGYRTQRDTENCEKMYESYKSLGGNSYIKEALEEFRELPLYTVEKFKKMQKGER